MRSSAPCRAALTRSRPRGYSTLAEDLARGGHEVVDVILPTDFAPAICFGVRRSGSPRSMDYDTNPCSEEWSFEERGICYWLNPSGIATFLSMGDPAKINIVGTGKTRADGRHRGSARRGEGGA
jgi:hypothetical protein